MLLDNMIAHRGAAGRSETLAVIAVDPHLDVVG